MRLSNRYYQIAEDVKKKEAEYHLLSDQELKHLTVEFKERLKNGTNLDDLLTDAFAAVCEASARVLKMDPYKEQIIGGILLHEGKISELRTGEGKTLVAVLPAYLNSLTGKGVHVVTVNDYLAQRDEEQMSQVFSFMGVSTGLILANMEQDERKEAYSCDITYVTNSEVGFDYLRDNMALSNDELVLRGLSYAIIDEVDSILIDEARTPLIISGKDESSIQFYIDADKFVKSLTQGSGLISHKASQLDYLDNESLHEDGDFNVDEKDKVVALSEEGLTKAEKFFHLDNYSDEKNITIQHAVAMALKANYTMEKDKDYIVRDGEVLIVDEFTGRVMDGRRYSDGLHQALEAKECVEIHPEDRTLATITYQSFFNKYAKKSGMTGTAMTEFREFRDIYHMECCAVPTHRPVQRIDDHDVIYRTRHGKFMAIGKRTKELYEVGQPVLIGTSTIQDSEDISMILKDFNIPHRVLNAKQDKHEAEIISHAGEYKAVTIATNMAGRGTDIKLDDKARELGGLYIIGTQRHESRRIDNQLRGRSGRQGDPGYSQFYLSLEDDLLRLFGSEGLNHMLMNAHEDDDIPIKNFALTRSVETAQKRMEANNFAIRKSLVDYDLITDLHRVALFKIRNKLVGVPVISYAVMDIIDGFVKHYYNETKNDRAATIRKLSHVVPSSEWSDKKLLEAPENKFCDTLSRVIFRAYDKQEALLGREYLEEQEKLIVLRNIDRYWVDHINNMNKLRHAVPLQSYANNDPLVRYKMDGYNMFENMLQHIRKDVLISIFDLTPVVEIAGVQTNQIKYKFNIVRE